MPARPIRYHWILDATLISHLSTKERSLIEAAIVFANLQPIESNRQVEDMFKAARIHAVGNENPLGLEFTGVAEGSLIYRDRTQPMLRRWLRQAIGSNAGRTETASELMHLLPRGIRAMPMFSTGRLWYDFQLAGVDEGCALAVALLLDEDRGLTNRLQQCTLSWCGRFSVDFDARARPRKYCNLKHKILAHYEQSPERMRVWRKAA